MALGKLPPSARKNSDGSVSFPARGKPPTEVTEGYEEDPNDPYRWLMSWVECQYREFNHPYVCPSGSLRHATFCKKKNIPLTPRICAVDCNEPDKLVSLSLDRL
jgi:hypothetical protein